MKKQAIFIWLVTLALSVPVRADELVLSNGDRVSGAIVGLEENRLSIESPFLGTVTADWEAIRRIQSEAPLYLEFSDDRLVVGAVVIDDANVNVQTANAGIVEMPRSAIVAIRSQSRQDALEAELDRTLNPGPAELWSASIDGALSLATGNAETRNVNLGLLTARTAPRNRTSFYLTSLFSSNTTSGQTLTTANAVRGGGRYEMDLSDRIFTFGFSDLEFDRFQDLNLRLVLGGGVGLNLVDNARATLQIFGGGSSNQEFFTSGVRRKSGESVMGEEWTYRLNNLTSFTERLAVYSNLSNRGEYRVNFDSTATTRMNSWLSWQITLSDRFLSNPQPGRKRNDLLFTTGIRITLGEGNVASAGPGDIDFQ